jgi:ribosome maturation factor RimP
MGGSEVSVLVDRVGGLVAPVLTDLGLSLYDLDMAGGTLRVVIDRPGGIDLEAIAEATRLISRELDHADPIPWRYQLEVTSPGLERNLRTPAHFQRAVGTMVKVRTHPHAEGERRAEGVLTAADEDGITILAVADDGVTERRLAYRDVERAKTVFVWEAAPKPGKGGPKAGAASSAQRKAAGA